MSTFRDVRMRGFRERTSVADALALLDSRTTPLSAESLSLHHAAGRVLASAVTAAADVPGYSRAAMDGFAVRANDTRAASAEAPLPLTLIGESLPARPFAGIVQSRQSVRITTGAPMPAGADAVLMAEFAAEESGRVLARTSVEVGKHVGWIGEDVARGRVVLPPGRKVRPQDVGLIAAVGVPTVAVVKRPRVALLATGNELLPPGSMPEGYRIVDSNSPMLAALVARDGGECHPVRYVPDRYEAVRDAIRDADADVILVSGGSSVGTEDHAPRAVAEIGELAIHGIALRPARPAGLGFIASRNVVLLPGNPVSCLCAYDLFAGRIVRRLGGRTWDLPYRTATHLLAEEIVSEIGRTDYVRVKVTADGAHPLATSGASILSSTVNADGFVLVEHDCERIAAGERVCVWLYD